MAWSQLPTTMLLALQTPKPHPFTLKPSKTALVIVDMQKRIYAKPQSRAYAAIEGNVRLLQMAREAGVKVIFIQSVRSPDSIEFSVFGKEPYLLEGTEETEIIDELAPLPGEHIVKKYTHDPFARTKLNDLLIEERILPTETTIIVTGVSIAVCAYAACVGFSCRHYMTLIPMDCVAASSAEEEARAFGKFRENSYAFTNSQMIEFSPAGMETRDIVAVLPSASN